MDKNKPKLINTLGVFKNSVFCVCCVLEYYIHKTLFFLVIPMLYRIHLCMCNICSDNFYILVSLVCYIVLYIVSILYYIYLYISFYIYHLHYLHRLHKGSDRLV